MKFIVTQEDIDSAQLAASRRPCSISKICPVAQAAVRIMRPNEIASMGLRVLTFLDTDRMKVSRQFRVSEQLGKKVVDAFDLQTAIPEPGEYEIEELENFYE